MRNMRKCLVIILLCLPATAVAQDAQYTLNPGDLLQISVWKEEGMQREVLVLPDGMISFPLAGHLQASGQTPEQIQQALTARLESYIPNPVITVSVLKVSGNTVYIIGQVNRPGEIQAGHRMDVIQALSVAGGLTAFADENDIKILRRVGDEQIALPFDYSAVKKGKKLKLNILLQSGDVVVVPD